MAQLFENRHKMAERACPQCGRMNDGSSPVDGEAVPKPGDISICLYCGCINELTEEEDGLGVRALTEEEKLKILSESPEVAEALMVRQVMIDLGILKLDQPAGD